MEWTVSRVLYTALVAAFSVLRLRELAIARRNVAVLRARGAVEYGAAHYPCMVALHAALLVACLAEVWLLSRPLLPALAAPMVGLLALGTALRHWVMATLGDRWTTRVLVLPGAPLVTAGPYRWLRHPNYLGVTLELVALPLVHTAWVTALAFGTANAVLLAVRIRVEDAALGRCVRPGGGGAPGQAASPRLYTGVGGRSSRGAP